MNMRISGAKLPRLNTIIATQAERAKLSQTLKDQYKDADSFVVTDNGGLHLDYFPVFGLSKRTNPIRYPRIALDKFLQPLLRSLILLVVYYDNIFVPDNISKYIRQQTFALLYNTYLSQIYRCQQNLQH